MNSYLTVFNPLHHELGFPYPFKGLTIVAFEGAKLSCIFEDTREVWDIPLSPGVHDLSKYASLTNSFDVEGHKLVVLNSTVGRLGQQLSPGHIETAANPDYKPQTSVDARLDALTTKLHKMEAKERKRKADKLAIKRAQQIFGEQQERKDVQRERETETETMEQTSGGTVEQSQDDTPPPKERKAKGAVDE